MEGMNCVGGIGGRGTPEGPATASIGGVEDNTARVALKASFGLIPFFGTFGNYVWSMVTMDSGIHSWDSAKWEKVQRFDETKASIVLSSIASIVSSISLGVLLNNPVFLAVSLVYSGIANSFSELSWQDMEEKSFQWLQNDGLQTEYLPERTPIVKLGRLIAKISLYSVPILGAFFYILNKSHRNDWFEESSLGFSTHHLSPIEPELKVRLVKEQIEDTNAASFGAVVQAANAIALVCIAGMPFIASAIYAAVLSAGAIYLITQNEENQKALAAYNKEGKVPLRVV